MKRVSRAVYAVAPLLVVLWTGSFADAAVGPMSVRSPEARAVLGPRPGPSLAPGALTWTPETPVPGGLVRYAHAQDPAQPGSFYVFGGVDGGFNAVANSWRYDAATDTWTPLAAMPYAAEGPMAVAFDGKVYVAGGDGNFTSFNAYDIATNTWAPLAVMPRGAWGAAMGAWAGKVYLIGGDSDFVFGGTSNAVNIYDIATNTWTGTGLNMPAAAVTAGWAQAGPFVYVVGGWGDSSPGTNVAVSQRYDMVNDTWSTGPAFTSARADLALIATNTMLYSVGGDANGGGAFDPTSVVEALTLADWATGAWVADTALPSARTANNAGYCTVVGAVATGFTLGAYNGSAIIGVLDGSPVDSCVASLEPAALVVVSPSGVLEPAATGVAVQPAWRNMTPASVTGVTGTAIGVGDFTVDDGAATYGDFGPNATVSCTAGPDCYAVSTDGTRPGQHWDVTLQEALSTGQSKDWVLHIGASFADVPNTSPFYRFVETIFHKNVTGGCAADTYCPSNPTSREQLAVFALVAKEGSAYSPPACAAPNLFIDVPETSPFCKWIEELANRGVVSGCGQNLYCPTDPVTREQMAVFVLVTLDPTLNPPACSAPNMFDDVPETSPFCKWIEELANRGVVSGCAPNLYCPTNPVTREQMAVFLAATFSLSLYGL